MKECAKVQEAAMPPKPTDDADEIDKNEPTAEEVKMVENLPFTSISGAGALWASKEEMAQAWRRIIDYKDTKLPKVKDERFKELLENFSMDVSDGTWPLPMAYSTFGFMSEDQNDDATCWGVIAWGKPVILRQTPMVQGTWLVPLLHEGQWYWVIRKEQSHYDKLFLALDDMSEGMLLDPKMEHDGVVFFGTHEELGWEPLVTPKGEWHIPANIVADNS